jgi:catechol 2,3-dioxygenase-like lactoylglutathione lyase family enzyme
MVTPIETLFEAHLTVRNLERSIAFYRDRVGLEFAHAVPARDAAFFWIGGRGNAMLGLWGVGTSPLHMRLHIAFRVSLEDVLAAPDQLRDAGIVPLDSGGGAEVSEPIVLTWMPAASVYFDDPDGHSLEYLAMLPQPPAPGLGVMPYSTWLAR